jgi:hypothetical protein
VKRWLDRVPGATTRSFGRASPAAC